MTGYRFDLLEEPWIPCIDLDGQAREVGLREALLDAHKLARISDDSPLVTLALHRLLLAVLHRVVDGPRDTASWRALWDAGRLPAEAITTYLERWRDRFDLFHLEHPFFQVAGLVMVDGSGQPTEPSDAGRLVLSAPGTLFDHHNDLHPPTFGPAAAARYLVATQLSALGGGQGPTSNHFGKHPYMCHASQVGAVAVLLNGRDLFETLLLNLVPYDEDRPVPSGAQDIPVWERTRHRPPGEVNPDGYLDYLTLPCRYIRLLPEGPADAPRLRTLYMAPGLSLPSDESGPENPFAFHRLDEKRGRVPIALRKDRAVWRDSGALFAFSEQKGSFDGRPMALRQAVLRRYSQLLGAHARLRITCFGLANDKAKPEAWRMEELPAPVRLLEDPDLVATVDEAVRNAETAAGSLRKALRSLAWKLLEAPMKDPDPKDVTRLANRMEAHAGFWADLDEPFLVFLDHLAESPDGAHADWLRTLSRCARDAFRRGARFGQGNVARQLRAVVQAEVVLHTGLRPLKDRHAALTAQENAG